MMSNNLRWSRQSVSFYRFLALLTVVTAVHLIGCGATDNDPVSSGFPAGAGFRISLRSSAEYVSPGGAAMITAVVLDPAGLPVANDTEVRFSIDEGGTFEGASEGVAKTVNGVATVVFRAAAATGGENPSPSRPVRIYASYAGAESMIQLVLANL